MSELDNINYLIDSIANDNGVPRNIKKSVAEAGGLINKQHENPEVDFTSAMYLLDECLQDINMPFHTRTDIMSIMAELEKLKEELK
ncbi:MAG: UPF0147 family protein [Candidatus Diapherotrites archaeon]|nr:UPF0147 family protein [Candidatus Diapherotrites archaeon]